MLCPSCHTAILDAPERCPACGEPLSLADLATATPSARPETSDAATKSGENGKAGALSAATSLETGDGAAAKSGKNGNIARSEDVEHEAVTTLVLANPGRAHMPLVRRLPELTALAWRQPAVRAAVKTGASTLVLSLALNVARRTLAARAGRADSPSLPSLLLEGLGKGERQPARHIRPSADRDILVEEVIIYARRVTRR